MCNYKMIIIDELGIIHIVPYDYCLYEDSPEEEFFDIIEDEYGINVNSGCDWRLVKGDVNIRNY